MLPSLGVLFSLSQQEVDKLRALPSDETRLEYVAELDEHYYETDPERMAAIDESWEAMHRTLGDGTLEAGNARFPLGHIVLGGEQLYGSDAYVLSLKAPAAVKDIAAAVKNMNRGAFRERYFRIDPEQYSAFSENDFLYTWDHVEESKPFWAQAAKENRYVLFTVNR